MCWNTKIERFSKQKTADCDIPCFKVCHVGSLTGKAISPYHYKIYEEGVTYTEQMDEPEHLSPKGPFKSLHDNWNISKGLHSYKGENVEVKFEKYKKLIIARRFTSDTGHSYTYRRLCIEYRIVKCVIPKGAHYYENEKGELVSDSLKVISVEKG